jgi:hypothetical protein
MHLAHLCADVAVHTNESQSSRIDSQAGHARFYGVGFLDVGLSEVSCTLLQICLVQEIW